MGVFAAIIVGLSQMVKNMGVNPKWIPLVNIFFGLVGSYIYSFIQPMDWPQAVFNGLIIGLTASGLFSGAKNVAEGLRKEGE